MVEILLRSKEWFTVNLPPSLEVGASIKEVLGAAFGGHFASAVEAQTHPLPVRRSH